MSAVAITDAGAFAGIAREFCAWTENSNVTTALGREAAQWLARLHAGALTLPKAGPENSKGLPDIPENELSAAKRKLKAFAGFYYREFFDPDPKLADAHVVGDVEDDLLDVYKDVKAGLIVFERGEEDDALWHWSFLHRIHWGRHATSALHALHCTGGAMGGTTNAL